MSRTPDDTLAAIDDVITWHGSPDAMVRTAEAPKPLALADLPPLQLDPEAMRGVGEALTAQLQAFVDAMRPVAEQMIRNVSAASRAFAGIMNAPQMPELLETQRLARRAMKSEYDRRRSRRGRAT